MTNILLTDQEISLARERMLHIDIETRSACNLITRGVYNYRDDPTTDITVVCYTFGDSEDVHEWITLETPNPPGELVAAMADSQWLLVAHNAQFERLLLNAVGVRKYGLPPTAIERWYCSAYQMSLNNLPRSLENAGRALKTDLQKDATGKMLIRKLSIPQEDGTFNEDPELYRQFADYCRQDVLVERALIACTRLASINEIRDYWAGEYINDRGVRINHALASAAVELTDQIAEQAEDQIKELTDGEVQKPRGLGLTTWVYDRLPEPYKPLMVKQVKNKEGQFEDKVTLDRNARERLLESELPLGRVRDVVELAESVGSGSVAKFRAMVDVANEDHRVRGSYITSGAAATGRYSAQKLQVHNFSRDSYSDPLPVVAEFLESGELPDTPMSALKRLLRSAIIPSRGKIFVCGDWSAIEGCALPWLTDDPLCQPKLDLLHRGEDVYLATASDLYGEPVVEKKDPRRQIGKVAELALGYGGGRGSFSVMAEGYGVQLEGDEVQRIIHQWRQANPGIVNFWTQLEDAALRSFFNPHTAHRAGRVEFYYHPDLLNGLLFCKLPSGRLLSYHHLSCSWDEYDRPQLMSMNSGISKAAGETEWPKRKLYGGLLSENVTQAVCADLLRECLRELVAAGAPVVLHTHDEVMVEVPMSHESYWLETLKQFMDFVPHWAEGMPINSELWSGSYYRK